MSCCVWHAAMKRIDSWLLRSRFKTGSSKAFIQIWLRPKKQGGCVQYTSTMRQYTVLQSNTEAVPGAPAATDTVFRWASLCMQGVLYTKRQVGNTSDSCRATVTKRSKWKCCVCAMGPTLKARVAAIRHKKPEASSPWLSDKERQQMKREKNASDGRVAPRLQLDITVQEWTETKKEGRRREGEREGERGGNPLSAKLCWAGMFCRLFSHVTWLATAQRAVWQRHREGQREGGGKRRWIWREGDGRRTRRVAQLITSVFFLPFHVSQLNVLHRWEGKGLVDDGITHAHTEICSFLFPVKSRNCIPCVTNNYSHNRFICWLFFQWMD